MKTWNLKTWNLRKKKKDSTRVCTIIRTTKTGDEDFAFMDSGSDTSGLGGEAWNITKVTKRKVRVTGFENEKTAKNNVPIGTGITAVDLPDDTTVILRVNEATLLGEKANTLLSPTQIRENGHIIDERARKHGGKGCITADGYVIPMTLREGMMAIKIRKPTPRKSRNVRPST